MCAVALLSARLSVLPTGCGVLLKCRAADATKHLMLLALTYPSALSSCCVTEGLYMLSIVQLTPTKLSVMFAHNCCSRPQEMWESMGVTWEWTWYSQTVHAYTEPDLVGANAGSVGLASLLSCCMYISFACARAPHWARALLLCLTVHSICAHFSCTEP